MIDRMCIRCGSEGPLFPYQYSDGLIAQGLLCEKCRNRRFQIIFAGLVEGEKPLMTTIWKTLI